MVVPFGITARIFNKDFDKFKFKPDKKTYWIKELPLSFWMEWVDYIFIPDGRMTLRMVRRFSKKRSWRNQRSLLEWMRWMR